MKKEFYTKLTTSVFLLFVYSFSFAQDVDLAWAQVMSGNTYSEGRSITTDGAGNVYTTGYFTKTVNFDPKAGTVMLTSSGSNDIFVSKTDASDNLIWAKKLGGTGSDYGYSISVDAAGNVYTTGCFTGTADFDPGSGVFNLTSAGGFDIFISKLDASGNFAMGEKNRKYL